MLEVFATKYRALQLGSRSITDLVQIAWQSVRRRTLGKTPAIFVALPEDLSN